MLLTPFGKRSQGRPQRDAISAEAILRVCARVGKRAPLDNAGAFKLSKLLCQDFLRSPGDLAAQFVEALRPLLQRPQDQRFPLSTDDFQRGAHRAFFDPQVLPPG